MANRFTPTPGFAQSKYVDQMATALPGSIGFASDNTLIDAYIVSPSVGADGLEAGLGVVSSVIPAADRAGSRSGTNSLYAELPTDAATASSFAGVTVRNQQMDSNAAGQACWFEGRLCNVMRKERIGGRIWVRLSSGVTTVGGAVYWIVSDTTGHGLPIGSFSAGALGADTVQLTNARFVSESNSTDDNACALVELGVA